MTVNSNTESARLLPSDDTSQYYSVSSPTVKQYKRRRRKKCVKQTVEEYVDHSQDSTIKKMKQFLAFLGPAVLVSVGYVDPGNWATDIEGGSTYGYALVWVLIMSNGLAIVLQTLAARLGLVTGKDLSQQCANFYPSYVAWFLWFLAELAIAATDLAEVLGTAIGLNLLFGLPLIWGVLVTACDTLLFLVFQQFGHRFMEWFILVLMSIISVCFIIEMFISKPVFKDVIKGVIPTLPAGSLPVATGILGATIMPHNLYLHSGLVLTRKSNDKVLTKRYCTFAMLDGLLSLNLALFVNAAILIVSSASFYGSREITAIQQAYVMLKSLFGNGASIVFGLALVLAGQSSTITGTLAGQMVMEGFLRFRIRPWLRRMITRGIAIFPAALVILIFGDYTGSTLLLWSQVILSIQLPFAMIPLIRITSHKEMGDFKNHWIVQVVGWSCVFLVIGLNIWLVVDSVQEYFSKTSVILWVFAGIGTILFLASLLFVMFCKIEPKVSRFQEDEKQKGVEGVDKQEEEENKSVVDSIADNVSDAIISAEEKGTVSIQ